MWSSCGYDNPDGGSGAPEGWPRHKAPDGKTPTASSDGDQGPLFVWACQVGHAWDLPGRGDSLSIGPSVHRRTA